jgi:hypothetical protein
LHSAPPGGNTASLAESLSEVASWDWEGARILIEHCDASRPGPTAKGFLELEEEIAAIRMAESGIGMVVNWGRSAIEGRGPATPIDHVRRVRDAGLLGGIMFSGCTDRADHRGGAWGDFHLPVADPNDPDDPSLLDAPAIRSTLDAGAGAPMFVGVKVSCGPQASIGQRLTAIDRSMHEVRAAVAEVDARRP